MNVCKKKNNPLHVIKTNDSLLIPFLTSPTSFQNDLFLLYKQIQVMNKNNQSYGLHRLPLRGLNVYMEYESLQYRKC